MACPTGVSVAFQWHPTAFPLCFYVMVIPHCNRICREQWIRAKYERREFVLDAAEDDKMRPYVTGRPTML